MSALLAIAEIQGRPEGLFIGESPLHLAQLVQAWSKKVREQGLLPEVHYWAILEADDHFRDNP